MVREMKWVKKACAVCSGVVVAAVVIAATLLAGARLIGLQSFSVLSGSMEPAYPTGSLIYIKTVNAAALKVGDVITFLLNEDTVATHRIVEILPDEQDPTVLRFRTKGDANEAPDGGLVHCRNVIGTPVFMIPCLGYAANFIRKPPGIYFSLGVCAVLLLLAFLPDLLADRHKKQKEKSGK